MLIYRTGENCKSLVLQDKCNIEIFLSPVLVSSVPEQAVLSVIPGN